MPSGSYAKQILNSPTKSAVIVLKDREVLTTDVMIRNSGRHRRAIIDIESACIVDIQVWIPMDYRQLLEVCDEDLNWKERYLVWKGAGMSPNKYSERDEGNGVSMR